MNEYTVTIREDQGSSFRLGTMTVVAESCEKAEAHVEDVSNWDDNDVDWGEWNTPPVSAIFTVVKVEGEPKVRRPRVDLMPYVLVTKWEDVYPLDGVAGAVLRLDTHNNTGLYVGINPGLDLGAGLIAQYQGYNYDFDLKKVEAEALKNTGGNYGLYTLIECIATYCENRSPYALREVTQYCIDFPERIDALYGLLFEEAL